MPFQAFFPWAGKNVNSPRSRVCRGWFYALLTPVGLPLHYLAVVAAFTLCVKLKKCHYIRKRPIDPRYPSTEETWPALQYFFYFLRICVPCILLFWGRRDLEVILSNMAPTCPIISSYRTIWTHLKPKFIFGEHNKYCCKQIVHVCHEKIGTCVLQAYGYIVAA